MFLRFFSEFQIYKAIKTDRQCNFLYRNYLSLPFIPSKQLVERVRQLRKNIKINVPVKFRHGFRKFHRYIKHYWLEKVRPERISVFGKTRRTNNGLEVLHAQMAKKLSPHSNVFRFIDGLERQIFTPTLAKILQTRAGNTDFRRQPKAQRDRETYVHFLVVKISCLN